MTGTGKKPNENFPEIGTIVDPALFHDGEDVLLCYETVSASGRGIAILAFTSVIDLRVSPMNVEGLRESRYPVEALSFTEVSGSDKTRKWKVLDPRFWMISFTDVTVEIVFGTVRMVHHTQDKSPSNIALRKFLSDNPA